MDINDFFRLIGVGAGSGKTKFNIDGEYESSGVASGWDDYEADFSSGTSSPSKEPTFDPMGNGLYAYNFAEGDDRFVSFHIKHDILVGSNVYPHIHFCPATTMTVGQTIVWTFDYVAPKGHAQAESFFGATSQISMTYTADGTEIAGEHLVLECSDIQAILAPEVDSIMYVKVTRGVGTYVGGVYGIKADLHYKKGRLSTKNKAPNFYT